MLSGYPSLPFPRAVKTMSWKYLVTYLIKRNITAINIKIDNLIHFKGKLRPISNTSHISIRILTAILMKLPGIQRMRASWNHRDCPKQMSRISRSYRTTPIKWRGYGTSASWRSNGCRFLWIRILIVLIAICTKLIEISRKHLCARTRRL